jgi:catechol 2,3-dioxygenase-like lactoylglutathione lyase family enzyme
MDPVPRTEEALMAPKKTSKKAAARARKAVRARKPTGARKTAARRPAARPAGLLRKSTEPPPILRARRQPESLRLRSAGPSFTVADLAASRAFYRDILGFVEGELWEQDGVVRGVELVAGAVRFWIGQDDWKKGRDRVKGVGFRMWCETSQDVDTIAARIDARGGRLTEGPKNQPWGGRELTVTDPDGFVITISSRV